MKHVIPEDYEVGKPRRSAKECEKLVYTSWGIRIYESGLLDIRVASVGYTTPETRTDNTASVNRRLCKWRKGQLES